MFFCLLAFEFGLGFGFDFFFFFVCWRCLFSLVVISLILIEVWVIARSEGIDVIRSSCNSVFIAGELTV